jgi:hypothetical protein
MVRLQLQRLVMSGILTAHCGRVAVSCAFWLGAQQQQQQQQLVQWMSWMWMQQLLLWCGMAALQQQQ